MIHCGAIPILHEHWPVYFSCQMNSKFLQSCQVYGEMVLFFGKVLINLLVFINKIVSGLRLV